MPQGSNARSRVSSSAVQRRYRSLAVTGNMQGHRATIFLLALVSLAVCASTLSATDVNRLPGAAGAVRVPCSSRLDCDFAGRPRLVEAEGGLVAADHGKCSEIGASMLKSGGHAVDAAVAAALCQGVLNPFASGMGGGMFMMVRQANGSAEFINAREQAPGAASFDMFKGKGRYASLDGGLAIGIPLELKGLELAWRRYGRLPWASLVEPAAALARSGFAMHPYLHFILSGPFTYRRLLERPLLREAFLLREPGSGGGGGGWRLPAVGEQCCKRHTLAATLDQVAKEGAAWLYSKKRRSAMANEIKDAGGIITASDLEAAQPLVTKPLVHKVGELEFVFPPPPSSAAAVVLGFELLSGFRRDDGKSALSQHHLVEAMKHVFAARTSMGDPGFCSMTALLADMMDPDFAHGLRGSINDEHCLDPAQYGGRWNPLRLSKLDGSLMPTDHGTSHMSVVDDEGNAVSMTMTVNTALGSGVVSKSTGIIFNNEMDDFTQPGNSSRRSQSRCGPYEANFIEPFKRPLSSMSPMMVLEGGELRLVLGASGGTHIITAVLQVLARVLLHRQPLASSVAASRWHCQYLPNEVNYENYTFDGMGFFKAPGDVESLELKGNAMAAYADQLGASQVIKLDGSQRLAMSDPRKDGAPAAADSRNGATPDAGR